VLWFLLNTLAVAESRSLVCCLATNLEPDFDMLVERRLAVASRNLLRGGRNFSVQVADLDANKRGIPIPSMPTGEEFIKAKAAIKEHAVREYLYVFPRFLFRKADFHRAPQTRQPSGVESRELAIPRKTSNVS
jgi:hypothetical protein